MEISLEDLIDPTRLHEPLDVKGYDKSFLLELLERMVLIRCAEEKLAKERELGSIKGPVHLSAGQEAIAVGLSQNLRKTDRVFGAHRSHSHLLSLNASVYKLFAEVLARDSGFSRGMGGSMHLIDLESGFYGSAPIVSGTVPLAVGAAFDAKRNNTNDIGVSYLGDGALEEGVVHESLNLAKVLPAPVLFVVENNLYASHMHMSHRQPSESTIRFAEANLILNKMVDGNNVLHVFEASKELIEISRSKKEPTFLEAFTYRHYGHVDWRKDIDVGVERTEKNIINWEKRDPITRLFKGMVEENIISDTDLEDIRINIIKGIEVAWDKAMQDPYPSEQDMLDRVYKNE
tara:strand:- start:2931 stop:3968 length:1038 start_codon:yes stop_codon:yes gene_type:complete